MRINLADSKKEAKELLFSHGNSLRLILLSRLAMFVVLLPVLIYAYVSALLFTLIGESIWCYVYPLIPALPIAVFISFPMITNLFVFSENVYSSGIANVLSGFKKSYFTNVAAGAILTLLWLPPLAALVTAFAAPDFASRILAENVYPYIISITESISLPSELEGLISMILYWGFIAILLIAAVLLFLLIVLVSDRIFLFPYYITQGLTLRQALKKSCKVTKNCKGAGSRFILSFTTLLLLSALTLGLLLIFYTLPIMLLTYSSFASDIDGNVQE